MKVVHKCLKFGGLNLIGIKENDELKDAWVAL